MKLFAKIIALALLLPGFSRALSSFELVVEAGNSRAAVGLEMRAMGAVPNDGASDMAALVAGLQYRVGDKPEELR